MIGLSEKSGIEIESEYQLTGHPVYYLENKVGVVDFVNAQRLVMF